MVSAGAEGLDSLRPDKGLVAVHNGGYDVLELGLRTPALQSLLDNGLGEDLVGFNLGRELRVALSEHHVDWLLRLVTSYCHIEEQNIYSVSIEGRHSYFTLQPGVRKKCQNFARNSNILSTGRALLGGLGKVVHRYTHYKYVVLV